MSDTIQYFLLVFDRSASRLVQEAALGADADHAAETYTLTELQFQDDPFMEVVLIGSDSIETVRVTHANYFPRTDAEDHYFAGL